VRKAVLASLVGSVALAASAGVALSSPQFAATFQMTYSSSTPGSRSGFDVLGAWSDPGEPGAKPKELQQIKLNFQPGTRFDTSALPRCRASNAKIRRLGAAACPRSTRLGSVLTEGVIRTGARFNAQSFLFNARRQIIVLVTIEGRVLVVFRDDVRGRSITINLAAIPLGISLTNLHAQVPPHVSRRGGKKRTYTRTPPTCPASGVWTTTATFSYRDGSAQQLTATSPCQPKVAPPPQPGAAVHRAP
jgi:hypothetical protein